jgi:septal ring-binding cell division protein DamX
VSTMETPPPDETVAAGPPERRCPRCGSTLAPDQEWCLACGAAADTEIVEARGWRVPLYLGGGLAALAVIGVVLAILALANQKEEQPGQAANPSPSAVAPLPTSAAPSPTTPPLETITPVPSETATPAPTEPEPSPTVDGGGTSSFPGWSGQDGDYTVILKSSSSQSSAESFAQEAQNAGNTVGILNSDDYSSLNSGYWVVFSGTYATEDEAETALDDLKSDYSDAYIRQIST